MTNWNAQPAADDLRRRPMSALWRMGGRVVRPQRGWLLVCGLCWLWAAALAGVAGGQPGPAPVAPQPWRRLESTEARAIYYAALPALPTVTGAQVACDADQDAGGVLCVAYAPGPYRRIVADGAVLENTLPTVYLPEVVR